MECLILLASLILIFAPDSLSATPPAESNLPEQIYFKHLSIDDGLSANNVRSIIQDQDGFMWFATENGLNRYDGYDFSNFSQGPSIALQDIWRYPINSLHTQDGQYMWIGAGQLFRYDYELDKVTQYDVTDHLGIRNIISDRDGNLWFGGERSGLRKFNPRTETLVKVYHPNDFEKSDKSDTINDIEIDLQGQIWVASDEGLFVFNEQQDRLESPIVDFALNNGVISSLALGPEGRLWIGTWKGLFRLDTISCQLTAYFAESGSDQTVHNDQIHSLMTDSHGNIWIGTDKQGVAVFDQAEKRFKHYLAGYNNPYQLGGGAINDIFEDRDHGIWIASQGFGLYRFDPKNQLFRCFAPNPDNPEMLNHPQVLSIEEGDNDDIWIATDGGGLNRLQGYHKYQEPVFTRYQHDPGDENSLSSDSVIGLAREFGDGDVWLGMWAGGLNKLVPDTGRFSHWRAKSPENSADDRPTDSESVSLASDNIFTLYIDRNRLLWISVWGIGVQVLDLETEQLQPPLVGNPAGNQSTMNNNDVMAILQDNKGIMWFGGYNGLDRYDPSTGEFVNYRSTGDDGPGLRTNIIYAIHQGQGNSLWLGTDRGLYHFRPDTGEFKNYGMLGAMADSNILGILEDFQGNLWLSTRYGLSRFAPDTGEFKNYFAEQGLQSNEFNRFAFEHLTSGEMVFGGVNGFNIFNPEAVNVPKNPPRVALTNLLLFNRPVGVDEENRLKGTVNNVDTVHLLPKDATFSLTFSALEYGTPEGIRYRYRMDGLDSVWLSTDASHRIATYTHLKPKTHTFRVQAQFENSPWGPEKRVKIYVTPHWYETIVFRIVFILAILSFISAMYWLRIKRLKLHMEAKQHEKEVKLFKEKNRELNKINTELESLAREKHDLLHLVAHDLRSPLTGIQLTVDYLGMLGTEEKVSELNSSMNQIQSMVARMIAMINKLLKENRKVAITISPEERIAVTSSIIQIMDEHNRMCEKKEIRLSYLTPLEESVFAHGNPTAFYQVMDNLISNAVKFSFPKSRVEVRSMEINDMIVISVTDQGQGMTPKDLNQVFGRRVQLSAKPTAGEYSSGFGLFSAKRLVNQMGGTLRAKSDGPGKGATFIVQLNKNTK